MNDLKRYAVVDGAGQTLLETDELQAALDCNREGSDREIIDCLPFMQAQTCH